MARIASPRAAALATPFGEGPVAVLASGADFADALAAAPLAALEGAPLLLAQPDAVPPATAAALTARAASRVILAGGPAAINDTVASQLG